jgi:mycothiol synthase
VRGVFTITLHDAATESDAEIAERVTLENELTREVLPDDPPASVEQAIAVSRARPLRLRRYLWKVRDQSGRLMGLAGTTIDPEDTDNPDVLGCGLVLAREARRRGTGSRLLAELVRIAEAEGRTRIFSATIHGQVGGREFAEALGAEPKLAEHLNHLPLCEVDRSMLDRWVADAATRSAGYELIGWDGPVPDEHLARWVDLVLVMNTAPRDDLQVNDFTLTPDEVREDERVSAAAGVEDWTLVARHRATGEWAGFHDVSWDPSEPTFVHVGGTAVKPDHRGHALGKWLKAAMTLRVLDERPEVTHIRTGNADSNAAMLGINKLMGYRPLLATTVWEIPVATAAAWLEARAAAHG